MITRPLSRLPVILSLMDKRFITTIPKNQNLIQSCLKVIGDNVRIHGPTADEVLEDIDLSNKTCLITGANSGIGLEMTRNLSAHNCTVLMACRNKYAASFVTNFCENDRRLQCYEINLASLKSVKQCSEKILKDQKKIDIVLLNAGVFGLPWTLTENNIETTFQVNYLSQLYLLMNIEQILADDARVVFVSSESHRNINWSLQNQLTPTVEQLTLPKHEYTSIRAYNVSKLCGILAMHYFGYRWLNTGKAIFCAHPGSFVRTRLSRNWWVFETLYASMKPFSKSISQAASTPIYCATSPDLKGLSGLYFKDCRRCEESDLAKDFQLSFRINDLSRELIRNSIAASDIAKPLDKKSVSREPSKDAIDDNLISNYTT